MARHRTRDRGHYTALSLALIYLLAQHYGRWSGTPTELLAALEACWWDLRGLPPPPRSPAWLVRDLRRAPDLPCSVAVWRQARRRVIQLWRGGGTLQYNIERTQ
jgi:hypothetical protein